MSRRTIVAVVATALVVALGGCGDQPAEPRPLATGTPTPTPSVTPTPWPSIPPDLDEEETAAAQEVLAVYDRFLDLEISLAADPPPVAESDELLNEYTTSVLHGRVLLAMHMLSDHNLARTGAPESRVQVSEVDLDGTAPLVTTVECIDTTGWGLVGSGGGPVPSDEAPPELYGLEPGTYVRTVEAGRFGDGRWLLRDYDRPLLQELSEVEDAPC